MLASLFNVFKDQNGMSQFSFANNDSHVRINNAIHAKYNYVIPTYVLDPIPFHDLPAWLNTHQNIHDYVDSALGIAGNDLSDVDWRNTDQLESWIWLHAQEHYQAETSLGIG
jgi:hypothetical protein